MGLNNSELSRLIEFRTFGKEVGGVVVDIVIDEHTINTGTAAQLRRELQMRADLVNASDGTYRSRHDPCDRYKVVVPQVDIDPF